LAQAILAHVKKVLTKVGIQRPPFKPHNPAMVFMAQTNECFCGALAGIRLRAKAAAKLIPLASLPPQLPSSVELPAKLAAELRAASGGTDLECALAGVVGPILAALLGAADGLGFTERQRQQLHVACRREIRQLQRAVGPQAALGAAAVPSPERDEATARMDAFNVLVAWCSTPALPTYSVGLRLALGEGQEDKDPLRMVSTDLAWVFRLLCARARVRDSKEAPMLFAACNALCGNGETGKGLQHALAFGMKLNRTQSLASPSETDKKNDMSSHDGRWCRLLSEGNIDMGPGKRTRNNSATDS